MNEFATSIPSFTSREETAIQQFIDVLQKQGKGAIHTVVLYGSKARGVARSDSDIDLLIVMGSDTWAVRNQVSQIASRISLEFDLLLSPHVISIGLTQTSENL